MPNDGGFLSNISRQEADEINATDITASKYLRRIIGAREMIHNEERYCLWLVDASPTELRDSKILKSRVEKVLALRKESRRPATQRLAEKPHEFGEIRQPKTSYIAVPRITSEEREYVPIGFYGPEIIMNDKISFINNGDLFIFGILSSKTFNVWNKAISGRTEMRTLISNTITYNNFPFPKVSSEDKNSIEEAAKRVLEARLQFPDDSFAALYDKSSMPSKLLIAHKDLDKAVLKSFSMKATSSDEEILEDLFETFLSLQSETLL
jgi:hypothetical protein